VRLISLILATTWLCAGSTAAARDEVGPATSAAVEQKIARDMGGHMFLPSHLIDNPFSETFVWMSIGLGAGEALGATIQPDPPAVLPESRWYGYTGLGLLASGGVRVLEYLSVRGAVGTSAYLGSGRDAALTIGSSARISGGMGAKGSLPVGENLRFAATFDASYGPVYSILIAQGLLDAINSGQISTSEFLQAYDTFTWIGGLVGSWAPWPFLGFTLDGKFLAPTKTGKASYAQNGIFAAAMADFDARPIWAWLPLGLNAAYTITSPVGGNGVSTLQEFGFGLYYTGRRDLGLGLQFEWKQGRLESQQASRATLVWLDLKYYWD
jgi:hypothetical protein